MPQNPTPHVWFNLDSNSSVKPAGWNIYNPNAPTQATQAIVNRWAILGGGTGPALFDPITKRMAAYWEVQLSQVNDAQLAQYDVLLLNAKDKVALNPLEREKLRQFVDRGGVLWVEVAGIDTAQFTDNNINNFPLPFSVGTGTGTGNLDSFSPLMSYPYQFDITNLGYLNGTNNLTMIPAAPPFGGSFEAPVLSDWIRLKPIVLAGGNATMMLGRIGDGFMVVTTRNAAGYLNQIRTAAGYSANQGYYAQDPRNGGLDRGSDTLGKLVINMISLGSGSEQIGGGSRKSGSSPIDVGAPLLKRYEVGIPSLDPGPGNNVPPSAYKGLLVVSANNKVYVYDADPRKDLDGDGNPDDGIQDYSLGNNVDEIWESQALTGPISAPTCIEVAQPSGVPTDQILVTDGTGAVVAFDVHSAPGTNVAPAYTVAAPTSSAGAINTTAIYHGAYAPTYHEGYVYVAHNLSVAGNLTGQIWMMDPSNGTGLTTTGLRWLVGDTTSPAMNELTASPTVGYIPIADNSGGLDRVVYVPSRPSNAATAGIYSFWAGVRGESPTSVVAAGTTLTVTTRAMPRGLSIVTGGGPLGVKLTVLKPNGDPLTATEMSALFSGAVNQGAPGVLDFTLNGAWPANYSVRIDYTIDWGRGPGFSQAIKRGELFLPDTSTVGDRRTIMGNIAMSPRGTIYVVHSSGFDTSSDQKGGAFYAFREQGQGAFKCICRYDMYGPHTVNLNQASPVSLPATVRDRDEVIAFAPLLDGTADHLTYIGGPVVRGDLVYVTAALRKTGAFPVGFIPFTVLFAFKAEPEMAEIQVGDLSDGFTLIQPDITRSLNKSNPTTLTLGSTGQYQYIRSSGKIRFENLMSPNRGAVQNIFNLSEPVVLRSGGREDRLIQPDAIAGSRWSPLAWYTVLHGTSNPTTPVVTGGTVFVGGASLLPWFLTTPAPGVPSPTNNVGVLFGMNADVSERDPLTVADPQRPWLRQVWNVRFTGGFAGNNNIRWPQNQGVTSFEDWTIRLLQAAMPQTGRTISLSAGEGGLYATGGDYTGTIGSNGWVYGFSRADFVVCDEGRLGRFDPAGNPIFASDVTKSAGSETNVNGTASILPLQRPVRAYPVGVNDVIAVDPGTNRVVRIDGAGQELRSISQFRLDPASPVTLEANEPLTLNNPRDVAFFSEFVANPAGVTAPQPLEFWVHYVIADSGNRRIVDLVDRYVADPATRQVGDAVSVGGVRQFGVLRWHSPAQYSGKRFEYSSIARAADPASGTYFYVAGIGSALPTRVDTGLDNPGGTLPRESASGNGGIVIFDPNNPANNEVVNEVDIPAIGPNVLINSTGTGYIPAATPARTKTLTNLSSVTVRKIPTGVNSSLYAIMFTDATGVYEITRPGARWQVRWMLPNEVYKFMRNRPGVFPVFNSNPLNLRATYARRLDSGEVIVVNGYVGKDRASNSFNGEVVQVDGDIIPGAGAFGFDWNRPNLGFYFGSVRFELPPVTGTRGLYQPVFADRR